jgi:predicted RNase H-like HicB family nuclease
MKFLIGMENGDENRSVAWVLGYPGCFAYGPSPEAAFASAGPAIQEYHEWILSQGEESWVDVEDPQIQLDETWNVFCTSDEYERVDQGYAINAWFFHDWKPLTEEDIECGLKLLAWSRADLLSVVSGLDQQTLDKKYPNERWNIAGIVRHVAGAEWWYLDRLGLAFPRSVLHDDMYERLAKVRTYFNDILPTLAGSLRVVGTDAEFWSPRKLLRRAVWHERDHTQHIRKLLDSAQNYT